LYSKPFALVVPSFEMKVVAFFLVVMFMASYCLAAAPRRTMLGRMYGQEEQPHRHVESRKSMEKSSGKYPGSSLDNHHSIPRQHYNDPNGSSQGDGGDGGNG
ncbi:unnamed protein product, partial [Prunus brigantina]